MSHLWRVSATEVKNAWGRVVRRIIQQREAVLVESKGKPLVVILPLEEYERLTRQQETALYRQRQLTLLDEAERLAKEVAARYETQPLPDSTELIRDMREARDDDLLGLR